MRILVTAIGKRVELIENLRQSNYVVGVDSKEKDSVASSGFVDEFFQISEVLADEKTYLKQILEICKEKTIDLIIPLFEPEFYVLKTIEDKLKMNNTKILLSDIKILDIAMNKKHTFSFFEATNIDLPKVLKVIKSNEKFEEHEEFIKMIAKEKKYPIILKPSIGMGSKGIFKAEDENDLTYILKKITQKCPNEEYVIQEFIDSDEFSIDVLFDFDGNVLSIVPRLREVVRGGEVEKSITLDKESYLGNKIIESLIHIIEKLRTLGKMIGPFTFQGFVKNNKFYLLEINPRFGGGVTLSINAGIDYGHLLDKMLCGKNAEMIKSEMSTNLFEFENFRFIKYKVVRMIRYDRAIYIEK